jgi:hypothetical protein
MTIIVLWCRKPSDPPHEEQLLTDRQDQLDKAKAWAESRGLIVREAKINMETPPDFAATLNL